MGTFLSEFNSFLSSFNTTVSIPSISYVSSATGSIQRVYTSSIPLLKEIENTEHKGTFEVKYYRVFSNSSLEQNGRFYTIIQNIRKELRKEIYMNREETREADFKALHPKLLYNLEGLNYEGDPYISIEGFERKEVKELFQILLNSKNKTAAHKAGVYNLKRKGEEIRKALARLEQEHSAINKYFCTSVGITLQNYDALLAEDIFRYFYDREIPIIGIHDSFAVPSNCLQELIEVMQSNYKYRFKYEPEITTQ